MSYETETDTPRTEAVHHHINERVSCHADDIITAIDHAYQLERELNWLRAHCRVVYYPSDGRYPIEHTMAARKDQFDAIIAEMPAHYLAKQRWVNLQGTSDMTPETVYPVTLVEKASGPATAADIPAIIEAAKQNHTVPLQLD